MRKQNRNKKRMSRSGFTVVELGLVVVIGLVLVMGAIAGYNKLYIPMKGNAAFQDFSSVISAINRSKMSNSNVYPVAASAQISSVALLQNELGGATNSRDVASWTYDCSAGNGQTVTLTSTAYDDPTVASIAAQKVSSALSPWSATSAGGVVTATLNNVTCN